MNSKNNHNCNDNNIIKITSNTEYNIFYDSKKSILFFKGNNKLITLDNNIYINNDSPKHYSPKHCNHHDIYEKIEEIIDEKLEQEIKINYNLFKFIGKYNDDDLPDINIDDLSLALVNIENETINVYLYVAFNKKYENLNCGWNNLGVLFNLLDCSETISSNSVSNSSCNYNNSSLIVLNKLEILTNFFDASKFKDSTYDIFLPNNFYLYKFTKKINDKIETSINGYTVLSTGTYLVNYNIAWFYSIVNDDSDNSSSDECLHNVHISSKESIMVIVCKIINNNSIQPINSSIYEGKSSKYRSNISHSFKSEFSNGEQIILLIYNLSSESNKLLINITNDTYLSLEKIL
jgi:hypothetical protein